ncbi:MAG TPA: retroviral-like aspartic protease family protein [Methylomirabilota bacterium]|nr:retroviral-like aspartic protease family protein [Methylomirabilota bacterium]
MGQFFVPVRLTGPTGRTEQVELLVDTGATLVVLPRDLAGRLEVAVHRMQPIIVAGGTEATWPVGEIRIAIDGREVTTPCFIAPDGPALLGAVALESLFFAVDPVAKRLVPTRGLVV